MISPADIRKKGIKPGEEPSPLEILEETKMAMTTKEIAEALTKKLPWEVNHSCAKQKMIRLEKKGLVERMEIKGLSYWLKV